MQLILVDPQESICAAWKKHFDKLSDVSIQQGDFEDMMKCDCIVVPANSFGLIYWYVYREITHSFDLELSTGIQEHIVEHFLGEQPIGTSFLMKTGHETPEWLAYTPVVSMPMDVAKIDSVYFAMWAMLLAITQHNKTDPHKIERVVCPWLGVGLDEANADAVAEQMALAYFRYLNPPKRIDWYYVEYR